ncbi:MAG: hypothetical protein Q8R28_00150 [Dehalococcoidia bacterium]|nr:hypothetical protein [Dehalococcoidia bacterium]
MKQQPLTAVKIGSNLDSTGADVSSPGCRRAAQHAAIIKWHETHPSAFWRCNPFEFGPNGTAYNCGFNHGYFDTDGKMHSVWVTRDGRIENHLVTALRTGPSSTKAVLARYGAFRG